MKIVINHLTRMRSPFICVAGVELRTGTHVRPVVAGKQLHNDLLVRHGGPFEMAARIELPTVTPVPHPPEVEDHLFTSNEAELEGYLPPDRFWELLNRIARPKLAQIFGPALTKRGAQAAAVDIGKGSASLGCLVPARPPRLYLRWDKRIRIEVTDGDLNLDLSVTDIRPYGPDYVTPDDGVVGRVAKRISAGDGDDGRLRAS